MYHSDLAINELENGRSRRLTLSTLYPLDEKLVDNKMIRQASAFSVLDGHSNGRIKGQLLFHRGSPDMSARRPSTLCGLHVAPDADSQIPASPIVLSTVEEEDPANLTLSMPEDMKRVSISELSSANAPPTESKENEKEESFGPKSSGLSLTTSQREARRRAFTNAAFNETIEDISDV
ncbi:hypothetical protein Tcan_03633 [Toxocara canis]|uniref:Uncharacterized protein n=1 Tax=Toxocara canis TaxID=6265 RepID=A0A0B2V690_TOXCA|nr:hypothetical protein Tcan_03633 [Toxocara canis]